MPFTPDIQPVAESIGDISLELFDGDEQRITYSIQVIMSDGRTAVKTGNAIPHLTAAQISGLQALMVYVRQEAQGLIP